MNKHELFYRTGLLPVCLLSIMAGLGGCVTSDPMPKSQWARFNGDEIVAVESKTFFSQHRVTTLNGHSLYDRRNPIVYEEGIDCLRRICRLYPGSYSIEVEYGWSSMEDEKKRSRKDTWKGAGYALGTLLGLEINSPSSSHQPGYPCHVALSFEVQAKHSYMLNVVHTDLHSRPEELQIIEVESGAVVASSSCR